MERGRHPKVVIETMLRSTSRLQPPLSLDQPLGQHLLLLVPDLLIIIKDQCPSSRWVLLMPERMKDKDLVFHNGLDQH